MVDNMDNRKYKRVDKEFEIMLSMDSAQEFETEYSFIKGKSINISMGGILFTYGEEIPLSKKVEVTIFLPDSKDLITIHGETRRVEPFRNKYKIAVEFESFVGRSEALLVEVIDHLEE